MSNNLALFVIHHVFLTDDEISTLMSGGSASIVGHCVPVWVNAKTGATNEPAKEVFCTYEVLGAVDGQGDVEPVAAVGYRIRMPRASAWMPPEEIDFQILSGLTAEARAEFLKKRDAWWFNNPKPPSVEDLSSGYLRFEVKKHDLKVGRRKYSAQHVVEMSSIKRLADSLAT